MRVRVCVSVCVRWMVELSVCLCVPVNWHSEVSLSPLPSIIRPCGPINLYISSEWDVLSNARARPPEENIWSKWGRLENKFTKAIANWRRVYCRRVCLKMLVNIWNGLRADLMAELTMTWASLLWFNESRWEAPASQPLCSCQASAKNSTLLAVNRVKKCATSSTLTSINYINFRM